MARSLGITKVYVHRYGGILSAYGKHHYDKLGPSKIDVFNA
jgi:hypothetical protein